MAKVDQRTLSALYHASLRAELTRHLGVVWHTPESGIAEMRGVPQPVLDRFSERTAQVEQRIADKLARFRQTMGRAPTPRERWRLEREAVRDSRPAKPKPTNAADLHTEWRHELRAVGVEPADLVAAVVVRNVLASGLDHIERNRIATVALAVLAESRSTWRRNDLIRELAREVPTTVTLPAAELVKILEQLADEVIAQRLVEMAPPVPALIPRRRDGRPIIESTLDRRLTLPEILAQEERLVTWATSPVFRT